MTIKTVFHNVCGKIHNHADDIKVFLNIATPIAVFLYFGYKFCEYAWLFWALEQIE